MYMERSKFEKLDDKQLIKYAKFVYPIVPEFERGSLAGFYRFMSYKKNPSVIKINGPFGGEMSRLDIEYLFYILNNNDFSSPMETIDRPVLDDLEISYREFEKVRQYTTYRGEIPTYLINDIEDEYISDLHNQGDIEPYDWDIIETYTDPIEDTLEGEFDF